MLLAETSQNFQKWLSTPLFLHLCCISSMYNLLTFITKVMTPTVVKWNTCYIPPLHHCKLYGTAVCISLWTSKTRDVYANTRYQILTCTCAGARAVLWMMSQDLNLKSVAGDWETMSAELAQTAPYANDLRWRVRWQRIALDLPFRAISKKLNIVVYNIFEWFRTTAEVDPKPATTCDTLQKHDDHHRLYVVGLVMASPDLHLREIVDKVHEITGVSVDLSTICRLLAKHGLTRKNCNM